VLEYLPLASLSSLMLCNTLAYLADSYVTKKMKCCDTFKQHPETSGMCNILYNTGPR
jgi:hypothetical protein